MKTRVAITIAVILLFASAVRAQTMSELLQKGIYTQDTLGDIDGAIRIYQQIIAGTQPATDLRRQATRRLQLAQAQRERLAAHAPLASFDGRTYRHHRTGLSFEVPPGWKIQGTGPSSDYGEMVQLSVSDPQAWAAVWMIPEKNDWASLNQKLDASPAEKVTQRQGFDRYQLREGTVQRVSVGRYAAMVAIADFYTSGKAMAEYMTWIYTENTHTFFFARVPADQLERLRPQFDALVFSAVIP